VQNGSSYVCLWNLILCVCYIVSHHVVLVPPFYAHMFWHFSHYYLKEKNSWAFWNWMVSVILVFTHFLWYVLCYNTPLNIKALNPITYILHDFFYLMFVTILCKFIGEGARCCFNHVCSPSFFVNFLICVVFSVLCNQVSPSSFAVVRTSSRLLNFLNVKLCV